MKVIKQGKLPEKIVWQSECDNCHSILQAEQGELRPSSDQRDVGYLGMCPVCRRFCIFCPLKEET